LATVADGRGQAETAESVVEQPVHLAVQRKERVSAKAALDQPAGVERCQELPCPVGPSPLEAGSAGAERRRGSKVPDN
jgi:hypothetical protein